MPLPQQSFSLGALFLQADPLVKAVLFVLVLASIAVWAVTIDRAMRLVRVRRDILRLSTALRDPAAMPARDGVAGAILAAGFAAAHDPEGSRAERRERLREAMRACLMDALRSLEPGLPFLATVGATAPFVGLFGTVWGVMASFAAIAGTNDTSLSVVAPGIAEALFSTAIGLAAAIPAVIAYNKLATHLAGSRALGLSAIGRLAETLSAGRLEPMKAAAE